MLARVDSESGWVVWRVNSTASDSASVLVWGDHVGGSLSEISEMYSRGIECGALWAAQS